MHVLIIAVHSKCNATTSQTPKLIDLKHADKVYKHYLTSLFETLKLSACTKSLSDCDHILM